MASTIEFTKYHGIGNDFVILDGVGSDLALSDPSALARQFCDRRFGVGGDGLLLAEKGRNAPFRMRMFNPDGSESEMCGNGLRCLAKMLVDTGALLPGETVVETGAGPLPVTVLPDSQITVDMGLPRLETREIGMANGDEKKFLDQPIPFGFTGTAVSMGNPHLIVFVGNVSSVLVDVHGPELEKWDRFPARTNVHFVQVLNRTELRVRTWERGAGATLACGTGACACLVAAFATGRTEDTATIHLPGGDLTVSLGLDGHVHMTGPAVRVFSGSWPAPEPA